MYGLLYIPEGQIVLTNRTKLHFENLRLAILFYKKTGSFPRDWENELSTLEKAIKVPLTKVKFGVEFSVVSLP